MIYPLVWVLRLKIIKICGQVVPGTLMPAWESYLTTLELQSLVANIKHQRTLRQDDSAANFA